MAPLSIFNIIIASIDCNYLPPSMNGLSYGNGCAGAVWQDGSPSKQYCDEDSRFPWWIHCCTWQAERCIPKSRQLSSNANSINGIWIEDIFYNKNNTNNLRCKNPNYVKNNYFRELHSSQCWYQLCWWCTHSNQKRMYCGWGTIGRNKKHKRSSKWLFL